MGRVWEERKEAIELVVRAKLLDNQDCGPDGHYGVVMKYELVMTDKMEGGSPADFPFEKGDFLYVVHGVPGIPRASYHRFGGSLESFIIGAEHKMRLKKKLPNNDTPFDVVFDPYLQESADSRYLCIQVDSVTISRQMFRF